MPSRLDIAKPEIARHFDNSSIRAYSSNDLASILHAQRDHWHLAQGTTVRGFIAFLLEKTKLCEVRLYSRNYPPILRYSWGAPSPYQLALSLRRGAYLSHGSAVFLHSLTDKIPKTLYVNREQSFKPRPGSLTQEAINRSFSGKQRRSNYIYEHGDWRFILLSGKNTGRLGVLQMKGPKGELLEVTNLERTLIDIVVRPAYAGGVYDVLDAFRVARTRLSTEKLKGLLKKLDYVYPYHQAIGFYMERAGYNQKDSSALREFGLSYDFYLAHGLAETDYTSRWRLFYPKGL
jgi:hypothetical protein